MKGKRILKIESGITGILTSAMALFLILNCQSIWQNASETNYHIYELCAFFVLTGCLYMPAKYGISKTARTYVFLTAFWYYFIIFLIALCSVSTDNLIRFLSRYAVFPFCVLYFVSAAPMMQKLRLFKSFIEWTALISWTSVFFFAASTLGILRESGSIKVDWFGVYGNYYNLYFSSPYQMIDWIGTGIRRNLGIFVEGPMYMIVLVMALLFCLAIKDYCKIVKWKVAGIVLALLTTASVAGYVFLMLIGLVCVMQKHRNKKNRAIIGMMGAAFVVVGGSVLLFMKSGTASYTARFDDYIAGIKCWLQSPVIGNGYENVDMLRGYMSASRDWNQGFSNTIFSVLAYGGLVFAIPFMLPIFRGLLYALNRQDDKILIFCIVYFGLYFTVIQYTFFINFFIWAYLFCLDKSFFKQIRESGDMDAHDAMCS